MLIVDDCYTALVVLNILAACDGSEACNEVLKINQIAGTAVTLKVNIYSECSRLAFFMTVCSNSNKHQSVHGQNKSSEALQGIVTFFFFAYVGELEWN